MTINNINRILSTNIVSDRASYSALFHTRLPRLQDEPVTPELNLA